MTIAMADGYNTMIVDNVISSGNFNFSTSSGLGTVTIKGSRAVSMTVTMGTERRCG